jgi:hypothetical protein
LVETTSQAGTVRLRPTPESVSWLDAALSRRDRLTHPPDDAAVELAVPSDALCFPALASSIVVSDDLSLTIPLAAPAAYTFEIAHFAHKHNLASPPPIRYQITQTTLRQAVAWDYRVADVILLLSLFSDGGIPSTALAQLSAWERELMTSSYEPGYCLRLATPALLEPLRGRKPFRDRTRPFASGREVWVSHTQASDLFRYLRRLGYILARSKGADDDSEPAVRPLRRLGLPLARLLLILRTYQHMRRMVRGLADPGLQNLERYLDAALSPDDRAAVRRLIESHVVALAQSFKRREEKEMEVCVQADEERVRNSRGIKINVVSGSWASNREARSCLGDSFESRTAKQPATCPTTIWLSSKNVACRSERARAASSRVQAQDEGLVLGLVDRHPCQEATGCVQDLPVSVPHHDGYPAAPFQRIHRGVAVVGDGLTCHRTS